MQSDLKRYEAVSQFGLLEPEDSDSFRMDCKPQPSKDLNIKLRDELQRCLASKELTYLFTYLLTYSMEQSPP